MKIQKFSHLVTREQQAIKSLVSSLLTEHGDRIKFMLLFGSKARGDDTADSDIDVLVITDSDEWPLKHRSLNRGARLSLDHEVLFNLYVIDEERWAWMRQIRHPLYRNIERNGVDLMPTSTSASRAS